MQCGITLPLKPEIIVLGWKVGDFRFPATIRTKGIPIMLSFKNMFSDVLRIIMFLLTGDRGINLIFILRHSGMPSNVEKTAKQNTIMNDNRPSIHLPLHKSKVTKIRSPAFPAVTKMCLRLCMAHFVSF